MGLRPIRARNPLIRLTDALRENDQIQFEGLFVENLDVDILAGTPFMRLDDNAVRPAKRQVSLGDGTTYSYGLASSPAKEQSISIRRAVVLSATPIPNTV